VARYRRRLSSPREQSFEALGAAGVFLARKRDVGAVILQELLRLVELESEELADLAAGECALAVAREGEKLTRATFAICTVEEQLAGDSVWHFY
jgi:hypothetical protein